MAKRKKNRALVYLRRSGQHQEMSLAKQLKWAIDRAKQLDLPLNATEQDLAYMRENKLSSYKDLRLDDAITGANLERPGFVSFINDCKSEQSISHGLIFRRDRFARPEEALAMVIKEKELGYAGVTLVFGDKVVEPAVRGESDFGAELGSLYEYFESGNYLRKLAEHIILGHQENARTGSSTGGQPPYGFVRALFNAQGEF